MVVLTLAGAVVKRSHSFAYKPKTPLRFRYLRDMSLPPVERATRSDARRNRARLIEVAAAAFQDEGLDVGVDEIARRAGVGVATLYRHFPAKTDLILAVMGVVLDDLERAAAAAVAHREPGRSSPRS